MYVQENIQPLLRYFGFPTVDTDTSVVSIANAHAVRISAHTGTVTGTNTLRVFVNDTNSTSGAVELTAKATPPLASSSSYEIFVTSEEAVAAKERAAFLFLRIQVGNNPTVPIAIEAVAFPARQVPITLPSNWIRIL